MNRVHFPFRRVQSVESLQYQLGMKPADLRRLARRATQMYIVAKTITKDDGSTRILYDTHSPLKIVLKRINEHFLRRVCYPAYITGGVPLRDYKSSADIHKNAAVVIKEDITKFFPSVTRDIVYDIWRNFFHFGEEVALLLTDLTTRDGHLEQGAPTSGYLANLALYDIEPRLVERLSIRGLDRSSRHVDDIAISSEQRLDGERTAWAVRLVYRMLKAKGLRAKREKHEIQRGNMQITILNLVANKKPSLPKEERSRIRALIHQFCARADSGTCDDDLLAELNKVRGQVYKLKRFHDREGALLVEQVNVAARALRARRDAAGPVTTPLKRELRAPEGQSLEVPW